MLSIAACAIPVAGAVWMPDLLEDYQALLWLIALVPAFLLAYHRGWRGAATAAAGGMAVISVTYAITQSMARPVPELLPAVVFFFIAISLGAGFLADRLRRQAGSLKSMQFTDAGSDLPNRAHAELNLEIEFAAALRGRPLAVVLLHLDDIAGFNARQGSVAAEEIVRSIGDALRRTTRRLNLSARFADDAFICILGGCDDDGAIVFVNRLQDELQAAVGDRPLPSISGGIATFSASMRTYHDMIAAAETALKQARKEGRGRIRVYGRSISLPVGPGEASVASIGEEVAPVGVMPQGRGYGRRALIVAEDAPVRALLARLMADYGFTVAQVSNVVDGVQCLAIEYDLLFCDISLTEGFGAELVRAAKVRWPSIQVLGIIQHHEGDLLIETLNAGVDRYVLAPLDLAKVRQHITELLARRDRITMSILENRQLTLEFKARTDDAEDALRRSEEASRGLLAALPDDVYHLSREGVILDYEGEFAEGVADDIVGAGLEQAFPTAVAAALREEVKRVFETGSVGHYEYRVLDGEKLREYEVRLAAAGANEVVAIVRNVTDRKILEEQLRQSQKLEAIGRLAGGLAHDFNNLLTVVQGNAQLLGEEPLPDHTRDLVQQIRDAADRGATLVRQLLAFGRKQMMQPTTLSFNDVIENTHPMLARLIGENIRLEVDLDPELGAVEADAGQLEQILLNLAVNARAAMKKGGHLRIATRNAVMAPLGAETAEGDYVVVTISDDGVGMDAETQDHIFEPFFTTQGLAEASGLGLATVYGIVRQSGGTISVSSEIGRGTTFEIALPRVDA